MKRTKETEHYWDSKGAYNKEFDILTDMLMPLKGKAATLSGEVIRAVNRLYYEYLNNGNINARVVHTEHVEVVCKKCNGLGYIKGDHVVECPNCGGYRVEFEETEETEIHIFYYNFIELLRWALCREDDESLSPEYRIEANGVLNGIVWFLRNTPRESKDYFSDKRIHLYDNLIDLAVEYVYIYKPNAEPLPDWYIKEQK